MTKMPEVSIADQQRALTLAIQSAACACAADRFEVAAHFSRDGNHEEANLARGEGEIALAVCNRERAGERIHPPGSLEMLVEYLRQVDADSPGGRMLRSYKHTPPELLG